MSSPVEALSELLAQISAPGSFATRRTASPNDLRLEVKGVGRIKFPITSSTAVKLCAAGLLARHGHKDQTRLDRRVRDTWEIPKGRISIDQRTWNRTLQPHLAGIRRDLGLPETCRLRAALHNLLIYEPGQFFVTHQDSEKADDMIGTLVAILPSAFTGGEMVIEHHDQQMTFTGAQRKLALIAFYADCHHQVRPVKRTASIPDVESFIYSEKTQKRIDTDQYHREILSQEAFQKLEALRREIASILAKHRLKVLEKAVLNLRVPRLKASEEVFLEEPLCVQDAFFFRGV